MTGFGRNGAVLREADEATVRDYGSAAPTKIKRVLLGVFLCGIAASLLVALIAGIILFIGSILADITGEPSFRISAGDGFLAGAALALMFCAFNWFVFYLVLPVVWLILAFTIGRMPRRGIATSASYIRRSAIWGAILTGGHFRTFLIQHIHDRRDWRHRGRRDCRRSGWHYLRTDFHHDRPPCASAGRQDSGCVLARLAD